MLLEGRAQTCSWGRRINSPKCRGKRALGPERDRTDVQSPARLHVTRHGGCKTRCLAAAQKLPGTARPLCSHCCHPQGAKGRDGDPPLPGGMGRGIDRRAAQGGQRPGCCWAREPSPVPRTQAEAAVWQGRGLRGTAGTSSFRRATHSTLCTGTWPQRQRGGAGEGSSSAGRGACHHSQSHQLMSRRFPLPVLEEQRWCQRRSRQPLVSMPTAMKKWLLKTQRHLQPPRDGRVLCHRFSEDSTPVLPVARAQ